MTFPDLTPYAPLLNTIGIVLVGALATYFHWSNATKIAVQQATTDAIKATTSGHVALVQALPGLLNDARAVGAAMEPAAPSNGGTFSPTNAPLAFPQSTTSSP